MSRDPLRYFRIEARQLLDELTRGVLDLERGTGDRATLVTGLMRAAHTLKGAARVVRQPAIAEAAHTLEDLLEPLRDPRAALDASRLEALLATLSRIEHPVKSLEAPPSPPPAPTEPTTAPVPEVHPSEALVVDTLELDGLVTLLAGLGSRVARMRLALESAEASAATAGGDPLLRGGVSLELARLETGLHEARAQAARLLLLPVRSILTEIERLVRETARLAGKQVAYRAEVGDFRVDGRVLAALRVALLHAVRNAIDHGIEPEAERLAAGKPAVGTLRVVAERQVNRVSFRCEDDGRGIDPAAVRRAAVRAGALSPSEAEALSDLEALDLIFRPGVTTRQGATELSGRGVGLDAVREGVARLNGRVLVRSRPGQGTTLEIRVPVYASSLPALRVKAAGRAAWIPLEAVRRALRIEAPALMHSSGGTTLTLEDRAVPFLLLHRILAEPPSQAGEQPTGPWSALLLEASSGRVALAVDRLGESGDLVVKPLPALMGGLPLVLGMHVNSRGVPEPVLDPEGLARAAREQPAEAPREAAPARLPVLVVDDSLTTRMLEQSILEAAGYEVDTAASAEEALGAVRGRRYGLILCDVEMPGMDGFSFVSTLQGDAVLRTVPVVLVTSRGSPQDRNRGLEAGARAYIVKSEFSQQALLATIRSLMGGG